MLLNRLKTAQMRISSARKTTTQNKKGESSHLKNLRLYTIFIST